jgi:hypothetical protein
MAVRAYNGNDPPGCIPADHIDKSGGTGRDRAPGVDELDDRRYQRENYPGASLRGSGDQPVKNRRPMQKLGDDSF